MGLAREEIAYADPSPTEDGDRPLKLLVFYPTLDEGGSTATFLGGAAATDAQEDATPAEGQFPVAIFSHGHQGTPDNATWLMSWLASQGFVAVAPEHTGNTTADGDNRTADIYLQRPFDVSATLDHVLAGDSTAGDVDDSVVIGLGHSFGGYTMFPLAGAAWDVDSWESDCEDSTSSPCQGFTPAHATALRAGARDARFHAFITLAGGNLTQVGDGLASVDRPLLQLTGELDGNVPNDPVSDGIWDALPAGDRVRVDLAHGDHSSFTDLAGTGLPAIGGHPDGLPADRVHRLLRVYVGAWIARHGLGATVPDGLLDGTVEVDSDATVSVKP